MTSSIAGASASAAEVLNISRHGFWLLAGGTEHFLPFADFPWFRRATIEALLHLEEPHPGHLYWPDLDIDLALGSIVNPAAYPLVYQ